MFIQITEVWAHYFKLFNRVQSTQDEKERFVKGNELKVTQVELFSFFNFKSALERKLLQKYYFYNKCIGFKKSLHRNLFQKQIHTCLNPHGIFTYKLFLHLKKIKQTFITFVFFNAEYQFSLQYWYLRLALRYTNVP